MSVLLALYNGEPFLAETLDSVFGQTFTDFELIVINDGSSDGSEPILNRYSDPRLRVLRQENHGAAAALQAGLLAATGEYVAFLDQDDLWDPENLASHVGVLDERPEIAATFTWFRMIDEQGREMGIRSNPYRGTIGFKGLLADFVIGANSNLLCRRAAIWQAGALDASFRSVFNVDICLRIALLSPQPNIAAIPRPLMSYRRHRAQLSRSFEQIRKEWLQLFENFRRLAPLDLAEVETLALSNLDRFEAKVLYEDGRYAEALGMLGSGFRRIPREFLTDSRNWLTALACLSGLMLPDAVHRWLERRAGYRRPLE